MNYDKNKPLNKIMMMVDLDDTISKTDKRSHLLPNWDAFHAECDKDEPNIELIKTIQELALREDVTLLFVTGRTQTKEVEKKTKDWLIQHGFENPQVKFRRPGILLKTDVLKASIVNKIMEAQGYPEDMQFIVVEDTESVIERFKKKFNKLKTHGVLVEIENKDKNPSEELRSIFRKLDLERNIRLKPKMG